MSVRTLPAPMPVRTLFSDLVGRDVEVATGEPVTGSASVAVYVTDRTQLAGIALLDLPLSAYVGGALALLPPGGVADMVEEGQLSDLVVENVQEVANVLAALFNQSGASHVKLHQVHAPGQQIPADVHAAALDLTRRLDLSVTIRGYGSGSLSMVLTGDS